jgi:hypothetical protein
MKRQSEELDILIVGSIALTFVAFAIIACYPSEESIINLLENAGYTNVELRGYRTFTCSEDDLYRTAFVATGQNNHLVSGTVCSAPLKGSTIRFDN